MVAPISGTNGVMTKKEARRARRDRSKRLIAEAERDCLRKTVTRMEAVVLGRYGVPALTALRRDIEKLACPIRVDSSWPGEGARQALQHAQLNPDGTLSERVLCTPPPAPPPLEGVDELASSHAILPRHVPAPSPLLPDMLAVDWPES